MPTNDAAQYTPYLDDAGRNLLARHAAWWQRQGMLHAEVIVSPLGDLWLPLANGQEATEDLLLTPEMLDVDRAAGEMAEPGPLLVAGDVFPCRAPYGSVPWIQAMMGCPIRTTIRGGSMRARSYAHSWAEWTNRRVRRDDAWLDLLNTLTELTARRCNGRYALAHTLLFGPGDLAEAVLGPELLSYSLYDHPQELRRFLDEATELFLEVLQAQLARIPRIEGGCVNAYGVWAPGTTLRTQCDASVFLSPRQYAEWFLPYDECTSRAVDLALIHLHSVSLHTVDALLGVERPQAIQVTLETSANAPTMAQMVPVFRRILECKSLIVDGPMSDDDVALLLDSVPHDGLFVRVRKTG